MSIQRVILLVTAMVCVTVIAVTVLVLRDSDKPRPSMSEQCRVVALCSTLHPTK